MILLPIQTPIVQPGDALAEVLNRKFKFQNGDIVIVSSKAVATAENNFINLNDLKISPAAKTWERKTGCPASFMKAVLRETDRHHGKIVGWCPGALLTELRPDGLEHGTILTANAGLDQSNAPVGKAIGWPKDPAASAISLRKELETFIPTNNRIAVIITDSCCQPRRVGVTAFALTVSGLDPLINQAGHDDLFGKKLRITTEAIADQLATAANFVMGNAAQSIPAVVIREHTLELNDFSGWVRGIEPEEDLFREII